MARAKEIIGGMSREIEVGQTYHGRVVSIKEFGAFVEVFPGKDGLVHISELADFRVNRTEDVAKMGEMIWVKCIGIDDKGPGETEPQSRAQGARRNRDRRTGDWRCQRADGGRDGDDVEAAAVIEAIAVIGAGAAADAGASADMTNARPAGEPGARARSAAITPGRLRAVALGEGNSPNEITFTRARQQDAG